MKGFALRADLTWSEEDEEGNLCNLLRSGQYGWTEMPGFAPGLIVFIRSGDNTLVGSKHDNILWVFYEEPEP